MTSMHPTDCEADPERSTDTGAQAAAALAARFGPDGVEWLDGFLADYVFGGEPLDRVLVKARALCNLSARPNDLSIDDD